MTEQTWEWIRSQAAATAQAPEEHLWEAVAQALAGDRSTRRAGLACALSELFREFPPEEITAEAAGWISRT